MSPKQGVLTRTAAGLDDKTLYAIAIIGSLLLSAWAGYAKFVPNPDAMYYLRAADFFSAGHWVEGKAVYPWPFYSLLIAAVMAPTGLDALVAVQIVNALLYVLTTVAFIALIARLAEGDRLVLIFAVVVVMLHPQFAQLRPFVIRDNGFYPFLLLALYFVVKDHQDPRLSHKLAAVGSILVAGLFRLEALFLLPLAPAFYFYVRAQSVGGRLTVFGVTLALAALLFPGYLIWSSGVIQKWTSGQTGFDFSAALHGQLEVMRSRVERLQTDILPPFGRNRGTLAYASIALGIAIEGVLRALTWPLALLAAFAFAWRGAQPLFVCRFVLWFAGWQVAVVLLFVAFNLFLDWRYAMVFALLMTIPAVFAVSALARDWSAGAVSARWLFPVALLLIVASWISDFPKPHRLGYLRDAGNWIRTELPAGARIITNDGRIGYFSGRPYEAQIRVRVVFPPSEQELAESDYAVIDVGRMGLPAYLANRANVQPIGTIARGYDSRVEAYRLR